MNPGGPPAVWVLASWCLLRREHSTASKPSKMTDLGQEGDWG